jgi:hypothetical protein
VGVGTAIPDPPARRLPHRASVPTAGLCRMPEVPRALTPSSLPSRRNSVEAVGAALLMAAEGNGHRTIASDLDRPASTVRNWLRRASGFALLNRVGVIAAYEFDPGHGPMAVRQRRSPTLWTPSATRQRRWCHGSGSSVCRVVDHHHDQPRASARWSPARLIRPVGGFLCAPGNISPRHRNGHNGDTLWRSCPS